MYFKKWPWTYMYMNLRNVTCIFNIHDEVRTYTRWQHTFIICQSKQHLGLAYPFGSVNFGAPFLSVSLKQPSASCSMKRLLRCSILLVVSFHIPKRFNHPVNSLKNCTFSLDTLPAASIKKNNAYDGLDGWDQFYFHESQLVEYEMYFVHNIRFPCILLFVFWGRLKICISVLLYCLI